MTKTALYRHFDASGALLYVGITCDLARRDKAHRDNAAWHNEVCTTTVQWFYDRISALSGETLAIQSEAPTHNIMHRVGALGDASFVFISDKVGADRLNTYLRESGTTKLALATAVGIAKSTMTELSQGKYPPSLAVAFAIEDATGGAVPARGWGA